MRMNLYISLFCHIVGKKDNNIPQNLHSYAVVMLLSHIHLTGVIFMIFYIFLCNIFVLSFSLKWAGETPYVIMPRKMHLNHCRDLCCRYEASSASKELLCNGTVVP